LQNEVIIIPKSSKKERLEENARLFDFDILPEDMERIDALDGKRQLGADPLTYDGN
jgi:diketogulonate reductase-like aldo/keto reductase